MGKATDTLRDELAEWVLDYGNPDKKSNVGRALHEIWIWQEIEEFASEARKRAWKAAQVADEGDPIVPPDEELRGDIGEAIVVDSKTYSCVVKVDAPRQNFDRDTFVALVTRKFGIPASKMVALVDAAKKETAAPLTKTIICVEDKRK